ncbi:jg22758 [Pararge aegeria aegeria]|uniref:Jg22758 protein n=1 Tax=Pararge aegeria aegeria TaxID=348720 RepID=A0A8S4RS80_9NEOP|nr:jg22758 [Pararge aegeria aegeria]
MTVAVIPFLWDRERGGAMESCYKLYTWINHTLLMLLVQMFWKVSQISDYFKPNYAIQLKGNRLQFIRYLQCIDKEVDLYLPNSSSKGAA